MDISDVAVPDFVEALPVAVFAVDADGRPCYANAAARRLLVLPDGGQRDGPAGQDIYPAFVAGTDRPYPQARRPIVRALVGETSTVEDMEIHRDGEIVRVQSWAGPITDDAGVVRGAVSVFTDITERKAAEEALEESEGQLREAQSVARVGSWTLDLADGTVRWSDELYRVFGIEPRDGPVTYEHFLGWVHPGDREMVDGAVRACLTSGLPLAVTQRIVLGDGATAWLQTRGRVVVGEAGPERLIGTCQDITELARAQATLEESERQLREAQEVARVGSWNWDFDTNTVSWSDQLYEVYGVTPVGSPIDYERFAGLVHPEDREMVLGCIQQAAQTGGGFSVDHRVVHPDGVTAWVHCRGRTSPTGRGRMVGTAQDITERKRAEHALTRSLEDASRLAEENAGLHAQVRARLQEVRASRARIVEAADAARRRLERDLHDGAQQRLISVTLTLRMAEQRLRAAPGVDPTLVDWLAEAAEGLQGTLAELRELARGLHPAVLTDQGLGAALASLAERTPLPVSVLAAPAGRLPAPVEAAAYFVVSEALANVGKHARARKATIAAWHGDGRLVVEVADDGVGGADPVRGSGLAGLVDRVSALDGVLHLHSPAGGGTRLRAEIPTAAEATTCA